MGGAAAEVPRHQMAYWQNLLQRASPTDTCVKRAKVIFHRVARAAGMSALNVPELLITQNDPRWSVVAVAVDEGVVLSRGLLTRLLDRCEQPSAAGEARLAFIIGHELAHHRNGHFWQHRLFQSSPAVLPKADWGESRETQWMKEYQADQDGMLYATMAAYDVRNVFRDGPDNRFLLDWLRSNGISHPPAQDRVLHVQERLQRVLNEIDVFQLGLRFYQAGKYETAVKAFDRFRRVFAGREVLHNLGVSHHQHALQLYCRWKREPLVPFPVALTIDPTTLARRIQLDKTYFSRGAVPPAEHVRNHLNKAIDYYREAVQRDPTYLPAYGHLGASHIARSYLRGQLGNEALKVSDLNRAVSVLIEVPDKSPMILDTLGVAYLALYGEDQAREKWRMIEPNYLPPVLEQSSRAESSAALPACDARSAPASGPAKPSERVDGLGLGMHETRINKQFGDGESRHIRFAGDIYRLAQYRQGIHIWSRNRIVELIEAQPNYSGASGRGIRIGDTEDVLRQRYGRPDYRVALEHGMSWRYDRAGIAFQLDRGRIASWFLFH